MKSVSLVCVAIIVAAGIICGCSSTKVVRTDIEKKVDLSGLWNDTDSRLVSEEMIKDCLSRAWLNDFNIKAGKTPVVIVGTVVNRSSEHINSRLFTTDLERSLINSGKVKFVAAKQERDEIRGERIDQNQNATAETVKPAYKETGADFMVQGSINTVKDEIKGKYVILYQVNLELISMANNEKAWIGQKGIKKIVSRRAFGL